MPPRLLFGCGEFLPGREPFILSDNPAPTPTTLVSASKDQTPLVPPFIPQSGPPTTGEPIKWKCVQVPLSFAPSPGAGLEYVDPNFYRFCLPCNGQKRAAFGPPGFNPNPNDSGCVYVNKPICEQNCANPVRPEGGSGGGSGFIPVAPQVNTTFYKCVETIDICPEDVGLSNPRYTSVSYQCVPCNPFVPNGSQSLLGTGSPIISGNKAVLRTESQCSFITKAACEAKCPGGRVITGRLTLNCDPPVSVVPQTTANGESFDVQIIDVQKLSQLQPPVPNSQQSNINNQIYNNTYNFFSKQTSNFSETYSTNYAYLNIFKTQVTSEVAYLINNQNSQSAWEESMIFSVTLERLEESLNESLLSAFQSIHKPGGLLVGKTTFLQMVRKHLLEGTLSEIDSSYYIDLASKQKNDKRIYYKLTGDRDTLERAALGLVSEGAVISDSSQLINVQKRQSRRERRFNTDINAKVLVDIITGQAEKDLFLTDAGIDVETLNSTNISVPTGDGDGYYMHIDKIEGLDTPLPTTNDIDKTYYVPPEIRYNALTLANQSPLYTLNATSVNSQNELIEDDSGPSSLTPMYLILDLQSTTYENSTNPIVSRYTGTYNVEHNQDVIDEHVKNNGLAVTRVNIHYADEIYRYILDSGKATLSLNDINLNSILGPKDYALGYRVARNMPFALIITPVAGSKYNPFNGRSTLVGYQEPLVRTLQLDLDIDVSDTFKSGKELDKLNLYNETGGDLRVGLVEPKDSQNILYKYDASKEMYTNTFYNQNSNTYESDTPSVQLGGISYMLRNVIDYIVSSYNPEEITWYDVIRRMPLNKVSQYIYEANSFLANELEKGYRKNLKIKNVLNTDRTDYIENVILPDDSITIIKEEDRK